MNIFKRGLLSKRKGYYCRYLNSQSFNKDILLGFGEFYLALNWCFLSIGLIMFQISLQYATKIKYIVFDLKTLGKLYLLSVLISIIKYKTEINTNTVKLRLENFYTWARPGNESYRKVYLSKHQNNIACRRYKMGRRYIVSIIAAFVIIMCWD